jgi:hypothetical protein
MRGLNSLKLSTLILCAILLISSNMTIQVASNPYDDIPRANLSLSADYEWIFDELQDPELPGGIVGDDVVYWGEDLGPYYNSVETEKKLRAAEDAFPGLVTYFEYGSSYLDKPLMGVRITKINSMEIYSKSEILIVAAHHAREAITVMDALILMDEILYGIENSESWAIIAIEQNEIYILPLFNPDGLDYTYINPWQRSNMQPIDGDQDGTLDDDLEIGDVNGDNYVELYFDDTFEGTDLDGDGKTGEDMPGGIDLNRNYDYNFAYDNLGSSSDPNSFVYRGEYAFEAPETDQFAAFAKNHHFYTSISLHSGIVAICPPWSYNTSKLTPDYEIFNKIIEEMQTHAYFPKWSEVGGYDVNGEWGDWMYGELDSLALTIETYLGEGGYLQYYNNSYVGIWDVFNPDADEIYDISSQNVLKHLKYALTIPRLNWIQDEYRIDLETMIVENVEDFLTIKLNYTIVPDEDNPNFYLYVEEFDEITMSWEKIASGRLYQELSNYSSQMTIDSDNEWRVYVGSESRGFAYHMNVEDNDRVEIGFSANQPTVISFSQITESPVSFVFVILSLAILPILRGKNQ